VNENNCIICYDPIYDSESVEIPTPGYEPDKFAHRECFLSRLEEVTADSTRRKMLGFILTYETNHDINYLRDKLSLGIVGWEAQTIGLPVQKLRTLINAGILGTTFSSNSSTSYCLTGKDIINEFLKEDSVTNQVNSAQQKIELPDDLFTCIIGYDDIKNEIRSTLEMANRNHYLMVGPPATAKSLFLMELAKLRGAYQATGSTVTGPGLTDALITYQPRILLLDELDKVKMDTTAVLLSVMETGDILQTKYRRHGGKRIDLNVFAAANSDKGLTQELLSRFDTPLYFQPYSFEDFVAICRGYLPRYEGIPTDIAEYISVQTWQSLTKDVRTARGIARRLRKTTIADVDRVVRFLKKYSKLRSSEMSLLAR